MSEALQKAWVVLKFGPSRAYTPSPDNTAARGRCPKCNTVQGQALTCPKCGYDTSYFIMPM